MKISLIGKQYINIGLNRLNIEGLTYLVSIRDCEPGRKACKFVIGKVVEKKTS
jgi:hypothetical protein